MFDQPIIDKYTQPVIQIVQKQEEKKPEPKLYKIIPNDNLTKIAIAHQTSVERLWAANTQLTDPNTIEVNQELRIPLSDEVLADRPLPAKIESGPSPNASAKQTSAPSGRSSVSRPYSTHVDNGINTYSYGYCTWYAKNMRPDLPNNLGNADTWYIRYNGPKGSTPQAGAIGVAQSYGHVVYVERVNGDGTVYISEMNYVAWEKVSYRTAPASEFLYIY